MSDDSSQQAAAEAGGGAAKPAPEPEGAQGDAYQEALDAFKEGEGAAKSDGAGNGEAKPAGPSEAKSVDPDELADEIYQRVKLRGETDAEVERVTKHVLGDTGVKDGIAKAWLNDLWRTDEAVRNAFLNRSQNSKAWTAVQNGLKERFAGQVGAERADKKATQDRDAVTSAVHSASKVAPAPETSVWKMSKSEFAQAQRALGVKPN